MGNDYNYLIPANSKKSALIFGRFTGVDLTIFLVGIGISFILMMFLPTQKIWVAVIAILPALIAGFLVFPVPNYHNVRTVIKNAIDFYTTRQRYIWKGWCVLDDERDKK